MSVRNFPRSLRFAALKLFSHGMSLREVEKAIDVGYVSIQRWTKKTEIKRNSYLSDEQINEHLDIMAEEMRELSDDESDPRVKRVRDFLNRRKFGGTAQQKADAALTFSEIGGDMSETMADIRKHFDRVADQMALATTPGEQIESLEGMILLRQLLQVLRDPPPITTMSDFEKLHKMIRENFGMDDKKGGEDGIDLKLLTARIQKNKIVDAEEVPSARKKTTRKKIKK